MDKQEARQLLEQRLAGYRELSYAALAARIGCDEYIEIVGPSGKCYQIEIEVRWDSVPNGNLRVSGCVDDGGLRAFCPLCSDFLMAPDGSFIGD